MVLNFDKNIRVLSLKSFFEKDGWVDVRFSFVVKGRFVCIFWALAKIY